MPAKSLELKHTIKLIQELASEIDEIEDSIQKIIDELNPPILSIPGMGVNSAAVILAEIGDFSNFSSPDKILAYAGCSPSTYQSGKLTNCYAHMEKRGSRYLRHALYNATKYVCYWNPVFAEYLAKKRAEGKHYNVALSHAMKKLVRLIYALQKSGKTYVIIPNKSTAISVKKRFCAVLFPAKIYRPATHPIILPSVSPDKILRLYCVGGIFFLGKPYLENFMSRPSVIPAFRPTPLQNRGRNFVRSKRRSTYTSSGTLYLFLRLNNSETTFGNAF